MFEINDEVMVWWKGDYAFGKIVEITIMEYSVCYKVLLADGEIVHRNASDVEMA